jgi:hypothetical protein
MKRHGHKKTHSIGPGHQNCGICHPEIKSGRDLEKRRVQTEVLDGLTDRLDQRIDDRTSAP